MTKRQKFQAKGSGWTNHLVVKKIINVPKYKPLSGSSYIKFPKELNNSRKGLINIQIQ